MAQPLSCDLCGAEQAVLMQTNLIDGSVLAIGGLCLPQFFGGAVLGVIGSDGHAGPPTKCQACRRTHERMTTPVAPIAAEPLADPSLENEPADNGQAAAES
jgi:hypothetical protein